MANHVCKHCGKEYQYEEGKTTENLVTEEYCSRNCIIAYDPENFSALVHDNGAWDSNEEKSPEVQQMEKYGF